MKTPLTLFLSGIDTDAGKTYATAYLAKRFMQQGLSVVTQKFIQTGCKDDSEDIIAHRKLMGIDLLPEDKDLSGISPAGRPHRRTRHRHKPHRP